jgi:hypothetical protein
LLKKLQINSRVRLPIEVDKMAVQFLPLVFYWSNKMKFHQQNKRSNNYFKLQMKLNFKKLKRKLYTNKILALYNFYGSQKRKLRKPKLKKNYKKNKK